MFQPLMLLVACAARPSQPPPAVAQAAQPEADPGPLLSHETPLGELVVTLVYHGTVKLEFGDQVWFVDPWSKAQLTGTADVILLTDVHFDHLDNDALKQVEDADTIYVAPQAVVDHEGFAARTAHHVLANGEAVEVGGVHIEAVPMYNLIRGPKEGGVFHDKGRGNGYILTVGDTRLYIAGDTECTPEMKALTGITHALLPMNLPYTMTPAEAAECVRAFGPKMITPIHYAGTSQQDISAALSGIKGSLLIEKDAYPGGAPW